MLLYELRCMINLSDCERKSVPEVISEKSFDPSALRAFKLELYRRHVNWTKAVYSESMAGKSISNLHYDLSSFSRDTLPLPTVAVIILHQSTPIASSANPSIPFNITNLMHSVDQQSFRPSRILFFDIDSSKPTPHVNTSRSSLSQLSTLLEQVSANSSIKPEFFKISPLNLFKFKQILHTISTSHVWIKLSTNTMTQSTGALTLPARDFLETGIPILHQFKQPSIIGSQGTIVSFKRPQFGDTKPNPVHPLHQSTPSPIFHVFPDHLNQIPNDHIIPVDSLLDNYLLSTPLFNKLQTLESLDVDGLSLLDDPRILSLLFRRNWKAHSYLIPTIPKHSQDTTSPAQAQTSSISTSPQAQSFEHIPTTATQSTWVSLLKQGFPFIRQLHHQPKLDSILLVAKNETEFHQLYPLFYEFKRQHRHPVYLVLLNSSSSYPCSIPKFASSSRTNTTEWSYTDVYRTRFQCTYPPFGIFDISPALSKNLGDPFRRLYNIQQRIKMVAKEYNARLIIHLTSLEADVQRVLGHVESDADLKSLRRIALPPESMSLVPWLATLSLKALYNWHKPQVTINIIANNRAGSLLRLCTALSNSFYLNDPVDITFSLDSTSDKVSIAFINRFQWPHGSKHIRHRVQKGGLLAAVSESWYPSSNHHYAVFLEDDIEVSPLYYIWVKYTILKYRYGYQRDFSDRLFGVSLYSPRVIEIVSPRQKFQTDNIFANLSLPLNNSSRQSSVQLPLRTPYFLQLPCSWGAVYFPEHWREFHVYITRRLLDSASASSPSSNSPTTPSASTNAVTIPNSRSSKWTSSWKKYFIEMSYLRGYYMLYPNFSNQNSFSTNHLELGQHVGKVSKERYLDFRVPLMRVNSGLLKNFQSSYFRSHSDSDSNTNSLPDLPLLLKELPFTRLPSKQDIPVLDLFHRVTTEQTLIRNGQNLKKDVVNCLEGEELVRWVSGDVSCLKAWRDGV
ncbi:hypothetical protein BKA69DRAFT_1122655 [Paraphysoderma sedebokerense]|nr:hypothetical protein BKA69DRAFT_1122655 [Paraphysoderma sedebokerense]